MAKRNQKKGRILAHDVLNLAQPKTPVEKDRREDNPNNWVWWYDTNKFPNDLAVRTMRSGTHSGIINSKHTLTIGEGLRYFQNEIEVESGREFDYLQEINANDESFEEVFEQNAFDFIFSGNAFIEGVRSGERVNFYRKDLTTMRSGKMVKGRIEDYYYSEDWPEIGTGRPLKTTPVEVIPAYNGNKNQKRFILHLRNKYPSIKYYGVPDFMASILSGWVDINYRIGKHNIDKFDNGFMPSGIIQLFGDVPEGKTPEDYLSEVRAKFTGEGKNDKLYLQLLDDPELKANIELFDQIRDGDFEILDKMADQQLVTAHGWFRSLTGLAQQGQLGNTQQIRNEFEMAMNMKVKPGYRRPLLRFAKKMMKIANIDIDIDVINIDPISLTGDIEVNRVLTVDEGREVLGYPELEENQKLIDNGSSRGSEPV